MIRSIITSGMIIGFIACAFVPPTDANVGIAENRAMSAVGARTAATLLARSDIDPAKVSSAVRILREVTPEPKKIVKRLSSAALTSMKLKKTSVYWKQVKQESEDKQLVSRMEDIEWATRKTDVRLCGDLARSIQRRDDASTPGDYLALCLAKVTGDSARCGQISNDTAPLLRKLCTEELAT